jgi:hypothetical protein
MDGLTIPTNEFFVGLLNVVALSTIKQTNNQT